MTDGRVVHIDALMAESGVKFGTSGARGLVSDMTDEVCYAYTLGFIQYLEAAGELKTGKGVAVGGDLRFSTDRIMKAVGGAVRDRGYVVENCGTLPTPALAYYGMVNEMPTAMVTGSHIPDDRNGIKYTKKDGEILKPDEAAIKRQPVTLPHGLFDGQGMFAAPVELPAVKSEAGDQYIKRYLDYFPEGCLEGKRIGAYQHSAVGREHMIQVLTGLGAHVTPLGFSEAFIPVDTEAVRPEDTAAFKSWAEEYGFDAIVSTDGDSDRPLIGDENGTLIRGDVVGILCAAQLGADAVVAPVSCNSALEKCGLFERTYRTKIGSPYVIEGMQQALGGGAKRVVGYEANGGFLLASDIRMHGRVLKALPTRDALLPHIAVVLRSISKNMKLSELVAELPQRFTFSNRLTDFPTEKSREKLAAFNTSDSETDRQALHDIFFKAFGAVSSVDSTDGIRITFESREVVHLRSSGNAPEFRCYCEAATEYRAREMTDICLGIMESWR
ncbi:MAG: phosphomannomutase [Deltaproteobacteria bacterium]|nr:phosphomannomutase [Deltaproteobacteria bacterium]